jgi:hypothetical protein
MVKKCFNHGKINEAMKRFNGALTFSPSDDLTHMVGPGDNWSAFD